MGKDLFLVIAIYGKHRPAYRQTYKHVCRQTYQPPCRQTYRGFTLLEILVALAIFAAIMAMLYPAYTGTFGNIEAAESQSEMYRMARVALERITDDIQSAYLPKITESVENEENPVWSTGFLAQDSTTDSRDADILSFSSEEHIGFGVDDGRTRAKIIYYIRQKQGEDALILYRSDIPEPERPLEEEGGGFVLCDRLYSINYTFQDENGETYDKWDSSTEPFKDRLPVMVSIQIETIDRSDPSKHVRFMTSISIPLARNTYVGNSEG